jgi:catechol 2,3-dioxygenase-like lactoylglutathione lyase family enzyme
MNKRVTGIGGIFFKSKDPKALGKWYADHLGLPVDADDVSVFRWLYRDDPQHKGATVWAIFAADSDYFGSDDAQLMLNYRVEDLEAVVAALRAEGVQIEGDIRDNAHGKFVWIRDPEGRRIELWQGPEDY